jgi:hypothetical protein
VDVSNIPPRLLHFQYLIYSLVNMAERGEQW